MNGGQTKNSQSNLFSLTFEAISFAKVVPSAVKQFIFQLPAISVLRAIIKIPFLKTCYLLAHQNLFFHNKKRLNHKQKIINTSVQKIIFYYQVVFYDKMCHISATI